MTTPHTRAPHEPSAWLRARMTERINQVTAAGMDPWDGPATIITPLARGSRPGTSEDRTCDRCRSYVPEGVDLWASVVHAAPRLLIVGGLCGPCKEREVTE